MKLDHAEVHPYNWGGLWGAFSVIPPTIYEVIKMWVTYVLTFLHLVSVSKSAPPGFPASGNGLWFNKSAGVWSKEWLPVGNGYLAAMVQGGATNEVNQLNIESLWSGGPATNKSYNGGNRNPGDQLATAQYMQSIRQTIFSSPTGDIDNIDDLGTDPGAYGSYAGAGHLISSINTTGTISNYGRWLDMDDGVARTIWTQSGSTYLRTTLCSHPTKACTQHITTTKPSSSGLPAVGFAFSAAIEEGLPTPNITCLGPDTLRVRGRIDGTAGMVWEILAKVRTTPVSHPSVQCIQFPVASGAAPNATLQVPAGTAREVWLTWVGDTDYSMDAGNAAYDFSFQGPDPHDSLVASLNAATSTNIAYDKLLAEHVADHRAALNTKFSLSLGQTPRLDAPVDVIKANYTIDVGDRYLEWLMFNFGRYLLMTSARGKLPSNLQGKWAEGLGNAWSADYHSNINIQMNYWAAEMTNLDVTLPLFDYFEKTWAPRGALTAQVLYNISRGWVTHNEMNIFGHTGMKGPGDTAQWANYPESNAWMAFHIWDHFDYTNDVAWWKRQGWPLLKGIAAFHLDKLIPDLYFKDSSLVVSPCNSPEQRPITFGCAHAQQMIWQLFNAVEKGFAASGDKDIAFLNEVKAKKAQMDKGIHIGSWGQLQEWKVDRDSPTDTHRHLSHLIGLYPGYAVIGYNPSLQGNNYTKQQVIDAATVSLIHRGNGTGPDADAGWEKAWRAACWAQLGNADTFYHEISFSISENFGPNLFSLYNPYDPAPIFQIDANLGYPGAVLNALIQAPDVPSYNTPLVVNILPALPKQWPSGSIIGARIRGGITINVQWANGKPTSFSLKTDSNIIARPVQIVYKGKTLASFTTSPGLTRSINNF